MNQVCFRFYAELNDFLPPHKRQNAYPLSFNPPVSVKHLIEAEGVPHPEVALILAGDRVVDFSCLAQPGDRIAVYPLFAGIDLSPIKSLRPALPHPPAFILDNHLGRLARYLRLLGFDVLYPNDHLPDETLAQMAHDQERVMLTRDRGLLMRSLVVHGYCLRALNSRRQLVEVLNRFQLRDAVQPWRRCLRCNGLLHPVAKSAIVGRLEPKTRQYFHDFKMCQECEQIYWKGSHYTALEELVNQVIGQ